MKSATILFNEFELHFFKTNDGDFIAIRPICQALGIAPNKQIEKLKNHPFIPSVDTLKVSTGADKKNYKMFCIPVRYVFGWLLGIHPDRVKTSSRDKLIEYQEECYNVLYDYFHGSISNRSKVLSDKTFSQIEMQNLENSLLENEDYKKLLELKSKNRKLNTELKKLDDELINKQLNIFE